MALMVGIKTPTEYITPSKEYLELTRGQTATGISTGIFESSYNQCNFRAVQASISTSSGAGSGVIDIEVSNDGEVWIKADAIIINTSGDQPASDGLVINAPWRKIRSNIKSISGTGAAITVSVSA